MLIRPALLVHLNDHPVLPAVYPALPPEKESLHKDHADRVRADQRRMVGGDGSHRAQPETDLGELLSAVSLGICPGHGDGGDAFKQGGNPHTGLAPSGHGNPRAGPPGADGNARRLDEKLQ